MNQPSPIKRRVSRQIQVGNVPIGGDAPIAVQSMTNTDTCDVDATVAQIRALEGVGADIVRVSVPTMDAAEAFGKIRKQVSLLGTTLPMLQTPVPKWVWAYTLAETSKQVRWLVGTERRVKLCRLMNGKAYGRPWHRGTTTSSKILQSLMLSRAGVTRSIWMEGGFLEQMFPSGGV